MEQIDAFIYCYHLDKFFNIPVTPDVLTNSYQSAFTLETVMNRTAPKASYQGMQGRTVNVVLTLQTQMFELDNPDIWGGSQAEENPVTIKQMVNALIACAYPSFDRAKAKITPPSVLIKFGETTTIRGVINGSVSCEYSGAWLKDGTRSIAKITFTVTETDTFSAEYIAQWGTTPELPTDLNRESGSNIGSIKNNLVNSL